MVPSKPHVIPSPAWDIWHAMPSILTTDWMLQDKMLEQMQVFNVGEDCPVFSQMFQFCQVRKKS